MRPLPDKSARLCNTLPQGQGDTGAQPPEPVMNLSLYLLTVLIWGTTWIALKWQLGVVAIPVSIVYRFGLAALVLFALLLLSRKLQVMNRRGHLICVAQGLCLFCVNFMCFLTASQWIPSGLVAVVFSTATLWNALNARVFFGQRVARNVLMGGGLGLAGLGLLFWPEVVGHTASPQTLLGLGLALLGTMCFSAGNMLSSLQQKAGLRPLTTNAWGMAYGAAMLATYCAVRGIPFEMDWSARYVGALWYLVIPGSVIGFTAYLTLVGRMGPERAAYCTVLFPVVALNVSAFAEGYQWTAPALAGLVLVMVGNVLVFRKPKVTSPVFEAKAV
ncbi:Putative membrane protein [Pseudomonas [fluorescens] SBW25]|uniref:Membrane protein n=2 Tax=Pseudomonas fluorescens TaxID=294 RepID=C3K1V1_PSEFS|nr:Putative membrane protein [Pseudomonas fluorescens SBW25]